MIERYLRLAGRRVTMRRGEESATVYAVIENTWKRNKSHFEDRSSKIGYYYDDYYHYIGPAGFDIGTMQRTDTAVIDGEHYYFVRSEAIKVGDTVQYYRGVLKKAGDEEDAFGA